MKPKQTPAMVRNALRRQEAVALRAKGHTYESIAQVLGFSGKGAAYNAISAELDKSRVEAVEMLRAIQHLRIEAIIKTLYPLCISGPNTLLKLDAIKVFLSLSTYLSRLLGLDVNRRGGGAKAEASVNVVNLIKIGKGETPRTLQDLSDSELLELVSGENADAAKGGSGGGQG